MKILHRLLKGVSLTGALFVFQACYGTVRPPLYEAGQAPMTFSLVSHEDGKPLEGIRIQGSEFTGQYSSLRDLGVTGADGSCQVTIPYVRNQEGPFLRFEDPEGAYAPKDTTLADLRNRTIVIKLDRGL